MRALPDVIPADMPLRRFCVYGRFVMPYLYPTGLRTPAPKHFVYPPAWLGGCQIFSVIVARLDGAAGSPPPTCWSPRMPCCRMAH
jgi:hypothetical protein